MSAELEWLLVLQISPVQGFVHFVQRLLAIGDIQVKDHCAGKAMYIRKMYFEGCKAVENGFCLLQSGPQRQLQWAWRKDRDMRQRVLISG